MFKTHVETVDLTQPRATWIVKQVRLCISITYNSCETDSRSRSQDPVVIKDPFLVNTVRKDRKNKHAKNAYY